MAEFAGVFMGQVGFEELKKHCRQGDDFCKEVMSIFTERSAAEQAYAKSLRRFGQRLSKACQNMVCSPLSTLWKSISTEADKDAESHKKFGASLQEDCIKPTISLLESQTKQRKAFEVSVESSGKVMADCVVEHTKAKKRHHQLSKEKEALGDQIQGARPKTEKDQLRLALKQKKNEELLLHVDKEYYETLLDLMRKQLDWESVSLKCCVKVQELERVKSDAICRVAMSYSNLSSNMSQQYAESCELVRGNMHNLDPEGEIRIIVQNRKGKKYRSERLLCDYYEENFKNRIKMERRVSSLTKTIEKFLGDLQKERAHYDGMLRLKTASADRSTEEERAEMDRRIESASSMMTFLDVNRSKLQQAIATAKGSSFEPHPLGRTIEQRYDKQGIMHSTFKVDITDDVMTTDDPTDEDTFNASPGKHRSFSTSAVGSNGNAAHNPDTRSKSLSMKSAGTFVTAGNMIGRASSRKHAPAPPQKSPGGHSLGTCMACYDYTPRQPDELSIKEGDIINLHEKCDADWWKGEVNGKVGVFPASYVEQTN